MRTVFLASLTAGLLPFSAWAQTNGSNPCDLTKDGIVDFADVTLAVNMALGVVPCTANVIGSGVCNTVVVQRIVNALGGTCVTGAPSRAHTVSINWIASVSPNVAGYNVYRRTSDGQYTRLNLSLIGLTSYTDIIVQPGQTYYYVVTAVDTTGLESLFSDPSAQAFIPSP